MAKLLLVEDNEASRDGLARHLRRKGFEVLLAVDGRQGVDAARAEAPDLILMDMSLPILVALLARRGLRRVPAVLLVVALAFVLLGIVGWAVVSQVTALVNDLPQYKEN